MAERHPLQSSFAYGEISPRLLGRSDTDRYRQSLRICENALTFSHGNAAKRPGTRFLVQSPTEDNIRLFDLQADISQPYVVELGWRDATGGYIRVLDRNGYVLSSPLLVFNGSFHTSLVGWDDISVAPASVEWLAPHYANFLPYGGQPTQQDAILRQQVTVTAVGVQHTIATRLFSSIAGSMTIQLGTTQVNNDLGTFIPDVGEDSTTFIPTTTTVWVRIFVDEATDGETTLLDAIQIYESTATIFEAVTPWSNEDLDKISVAESTKNIAMYFATRSQLPQVLFQQNGLFGFEVVPFAPPPASWAVNNYPHAVTFYQQRLWFASTVLAQDTLWGSQINDFFNFDLGSGLAIEAIQFEMSDRGIIEWIQGAKNLLIGADVAEYILTSTGGVITPGDIQLQQQSAYGCASLQPAEYANGVLYVGRDARRVRFMQYQFLEDGWTSADITWPSEHITRPLIKELHFQYAPDPLIWMVMKDGTAVSAVYETEQNNLVGWHRHPMPEGSLLSSSLTKIGGGSELWVAMRRVVDGVEVTYIERTQSENLDVDQSPSQTREEDTGASPFKFDCAVLSVASEFGTDGLLEVLGLEVLEGFTVQVVVDGAMHIDRTVIGGRIELQKGFGKDGQVVQVGLGYTGIIKTLPLEGITQGGSSQSVMKRRNRIFLRVLESTIPIVNGVTSPARFPATPMDEGQGTFTGDIQVGNLGLDRFAEVLIEMPLPKPYNILALLGDADGSSL